MLSLPIQKWYRKSHCRRVNLDRNVIRLGRLTRSLSQPDLIRLAGPKTSALQRVAGRELAVEDFAFVFPESMLISLQPASCRGTYASSRNVEVGRDGRDCCAR